MVKFQAFVKIWAPKIGQFWEQLHRINYQLFEEDPALWSA